MVGFNWDCLNFCIHLSSFGQCLASLPSPLAFLPPFFPPSLFSQVLVVEEAAQALEGREEEGEGRMERRRLEEEQEETNLTFE